VGTIIHSLDISRDEENITTASAFVVTSTIRKAKYAEVTNQAV